MQDSIRKKAEDIIIEHLEETGKPVSSRLIYSKVRHLVSLKGLLSVLKILEQAKYIKLIKQDGVIFGAEYIPE